MTSKLLFTAMMCEKMAPPFVVVITTKDCGAPTVTHTNHSSKVMKESNPSATVGAPTLFASKTPHHCQSWSSGDDDKMTNDSESNHSTLHFLSATDSATDVHKSGVEVLLAINTKGSIRSFVSQGTDSFYFY